MKDQKYITFTFGWVAIGILVLGFTQGWHNPQQATAAATTDCQTVAEDTYWGLVEQAPPYVPSVDMLRESCEGDGALLGPLYPPCANEDGSGSTLPCYWDAKRQGNGVGRSVVIFEKP